MKTEKNNPITAKIRVNYDYDICQMYFDDNFEKSDLDFWQYTGNDTDVTNYLEDLFEIKATKKQLFELLQIEKSDFKNWTKEDLVQETFDSYDFKDFLDFDFAKRKFKLYITKGYSQGDYAEVVVLNEDDAEWMQKHIDNIFWDAPVYGTIEIFASQYYSFDLYETEAPEYTYSIDDINESIVKFIKKKFKHAPAIDNIMDAIQKALPTEIKA